MSYLKTCASGKYIQIVLSYVATSSIHVERVPTGTKVPARAKATSYAGVWILLGRQPKSFCFRAALTRYICIVQSLDKLGVVENRQESNMEDQGQLSAGFPEPAHFLCKVGI